jgi:pimeloyl-ACP methyl ester carboxylesterase
MASTGGDLAWPALDADRATRWRQENDAVAHDLFARGLHPAPGARMAREQPAMEHLYRAIDALSLTLDKQALRMRLMATLTRPVEALRTLNVPTLWLTGAEDCVYPPFVSELLAAKMPRALLASVKDAGHSAYFERPAVFNRVVGEFLEANG